MTGVQQSFDLIVLFSGIFELIKLVGLTKRAVRFRVRTCFSGFNNDIGLWPNLSSEEIIKHWFQKGPATLQNFNEEFFRKSVTQDQSQASSSTVRKCTKNLFIHRNRNQETVNRFWLCFSPTTSKIY